MCERWLQVIFVISSLCFISAEVNNLTSNEDRLKRHLFTNYNKDVIPAHSDHVIEVNFAFQLSHIHFDEKKGILSFGAHVFAKWRDLRLTWLPPQFNNITKLHLTGHEVWLPDISVYNNMDTEALIISDKGHIYVTLDDNGHVTWMKKVQLQTICPLNMLTWPYDTHNCTIILGSWTHHGFQIDMFFENQEKTIKEYLPNTEFSLTNVTSYKHTTYYGCCAEPYVHIQYSVYFARRSSSYATLFLLPAFCVVLLNLSSFWLPPPRGEKILLNGITLIIIVLNIIYFLKNLPGFSLRIPLIVIFYCTSFVLASLSMIASVFVLAASRTLYKGRLPPGLAKILKSAIGRALTSVDSFNKPDQTELSHHFDDNKSHETFSLIRSHNHDDEWTALGLVLDRVCFFVYSVIFLIMGLTLHF